LGQAQLHILSNIFQFNRFFYEIVPDPIFNNK